MSYWDNLRKAFQGSKKKARKKAFLTRKKIRDHEVKKQIRYQEAKSNGDIETMAALLGVKLK